MQYRSMVYGAVLALVIAMVNSLPAQSVQGPRVAQIAPGRAIPLKATYTDQPFHIPPPAWIDAVPKSKAATITINYLAAGQTNIFGDVCIGWPEDAKTAFTYTANIWAAIVNSTVPISINACWANMGEPDVLGHGGPNNYAHGFSGAPQANTYYPIALANALAGSDLTPGEDKMTIAYNANFSWYLGTDGAVPANKYDFVSVVLHEMCHGLGFLGTMEVNTNTGLGSWGLAPTGYPTAYDRYAYNGASQALLDTALFPNPSAALAAQLISDNIYFIGPHAISANGGMKPKLYVPTEWSSGSSYSHWDSTFDRTINGLMIYYIANGVSKHTPGPMTIGLLKDIGWRDMTEPLPVAGDFDGDRKFDPAAYLYGAWFIWGSDSGYQRTGPIGLFGAGGTPLAGDFDGDRKADPTAYESGRLTYWGSASSYQTNHIAMVNVVGATPVVADFDGDGKADPTLYSDGWWAIWFSGNGYQMGGPFLMSGPVATPVAADFDGDGKADPAVYSSQYWAIWFSGNGYQMGGPFLMPGPVGTPFAGDFDGDGKADPAVSDSSYWAIWFSGNGYQMGGPFPFPL